MTVYEKSSALFQYNKANSKFTATLAQLGCNGIDSKASEFFQPLQKGFGFILVSENTGAKIVMRLAHTNKVKSDWCEEDVDVKSWVFKPVGNYNFSLEIFTECERTYMAPHSPL